MKHLGLPHLVPALLACHTPFAPPPVGEHAATGASAAQDSGLVVASETYTLPNGMTVILHEDHALPKVVIDTWFDVGSKDEEPGRTGFAHLFEHLMFMGTNRVPDGGFDELMEAGGGSNNASTSNDRTNYFSMGPSSLLPTLLWLDADRLDALADAMTGEKVDKQREVVRNERRQTSENTPYGKEELLLPPVMYPAGHPYAHSVIGSHEDLQAATLEDVKAFFHRFYVPANATLVVAGDFESEAVKELIARTFGAIPARPAPPRRPVPAFGAPGAPRLDAIRRIVATDKVQFPKLSLVWHSPAFFAKGDAELDLIGSILSDGPSSRLYRRLIQGDGLAQSVRAFQASRELGSEFHITAIAKPGADLEAIRVAILDEVARLRKEGPTPEELERVKAQRESDFLRGMEGLFSRADAMNRYYHFFGTADGFQRDLDRWLGVGAQDVRNWTAKVFERPYVDMRILPEGAAVAEATLDQRPADFPPRAFTPPVPATLHLSNGIEVIALERPGTRLFSGRMLVAGGASLVPDAKAGLATLTARMLEAGAGGLDQAAFAAAADSLGASLGASASADAMTASVSGLTSKLDATLDLFRDMVRSPNLEEADFERERALLAAGIEARGDNPRTVASLVGNALLFGEDDPRGRPLSGRLASVQALRPADVRAAATELFDPANVRFVFVGDFGPGGLDALRAALEARFGDWASGGHATPPTLPVRSESGPAGIWVVDRPGAPQTVIRMARPLAPASDVERQARRCVNTVFGGSFTSRLNQNLREDKGYTYGAGSGVRRSSGQPVFLVSTAVRTDATGASLTEIRNEFEAMHASGITADEFGKAVETLRQSAAESAETTDRLAGSIASAVSDGFPASDLRDSLAALGQVTPDDAAGFAASDAFDFSTWTLVLVGDAEAIRAQLQEAGFPAPKVVAAPE